MTKLIKVFIEISVKFCTGYATCSAVARPNGQPRQAGVASGVRGHAPSPPPEKF